MREKVTGYRQCAITIPVARITWRTRRTARFGVGEDGDAIKRNLQLLET